MRRASIKLHTICDDAMHMRKRKSSILLPSSGGAAPRRFQARRQREQGKIREYCGRDVGPLSCPQNAKRLRIALPLRHSSFVIRHSLIAFLAVFTPLAALAAVPTRPNFLILLADDLGYSDLGCYGGEIKTPRLDALAAGGLRFTQFYNTARCWPTRASLLTGYYPQSIRRDEAAGNPRIALGNRPEWAPLLPEMLRPLGYRTYHSGKWHLDGSTRAGGFDRSYRLEDTDRYFNPNKHFEDDQPLPPVPRGSGYYATDAIADHAIQYLKRHAQEHAEQPFFTYVAFIAPHFPIQALPEDIARYRNLYRQGWDKTRDQRWSRIQSLGLVKGPLSPIERNLPRPGGAPKTIAAVGPGEVADRLPWTDLTDAQRELQAEKMAVYAAAVDRMDQAIGRILDQLRAMGAFDNTVVMFLSDNGASHELTVRGDGHDPTAPLGSAASFICQGPAWSTVSNTPFRRSKMFVHEGGISTPLVVHWPAGLPARGELRHAPGHVIDVVPTVLDLSEPGRPRPRRVLDTRSPSHPGISLVPNFARDGAALHDSLWWLHQGNRALRRGDWKIVAAKGQAWELYNLANDRCETNNLAAGQPELVTELAQLWRDQLAQCRRLAAPGKRNEK
jgi:arylsulfatase